MFESDLLTLETYSRQSWATGLSYLETTQDPPPTAPGQPPPFRRAIETGEGTLLVEFDCSTGGSDALCQAETIVITQTESTTQSITVTMKDPNYLWHPEGVGPYKDVMVDGAELSIGVTWGGHKREFWGKMRQAAVRRSGQDVPEMSWPGVCACDALAKCKKTLETIKRNPFAPATMNKPVLTEVCDAVGLSSDWSGVTAMRLGGPFHRQNLLPGDIFQKVLDLTLEEWRTRYKTIEGYDPESGGRRWEYDPDGGQVVQQQDITPLNNDLYDKVIVNRAVSAGTLVATGDQTTETRCLEFGDGYSVPLNPPLSGIRWRYTDRDRRARATDFKFYRAGTLVAVRSASNPLDYPDFLQVATIWECDEVRFTWGAAHPDVDADLTEAEGGIEFTGAISPTGTVGSGEDENTPLDRTTQVVRGTGDREIELPANPLFYGQAEMEFYGDRYLRRVGRQMVEFQYRIPLNHMIQLGDVFAVKKDARLGGVGWIEIRVTAVSHSISAYKANRFTEVRGYKYVA